MPNPTSARHTIREIMVAETVLIFAESQKIRPSANMAPDKNPTERLLKEANNSYWDSKHSKMSKAERQKPSRIPAAIQERESRACMDISSFSLCIGRFLSVIIRALRLPRVALCDHHLDGEHI